MESSSARLSEACQALQGEVSLAHMKIVADIVGEGVDQLSSDMKTRVVEAVDKVLEWLCAGHEVLVNEAEVVLKFLRCTASLEDHHKQFQCLVESFCMTQQAASRVAKTDDANRADLRAVTAGLCNALRSSDEKFKTLRCRNVEQQKRFLEFLGRLRPVVDGFRQTLRTLATSVVKLSVEDLTEKTVFWETLKKYQEAMQGESLCHSWYRALKKTW